MTIISLNLPKSYLELIEVLIKNDLENTRSDCLRNAIAYNIENEIKWQKTVERLISK